MIGPEEFLLKALRGSSVLAGYDIVAAAGDVDALRRLRFGASRGAHGPGHHGGKRPRAPGRHPEDPARRWRIAPARLAQTW